jgi:predicted regulator of amino acid metabolism with ACT domain
VLEYLTKFNKQTRELIYTVYTQKIPNDIITEFDYIGGTKSIYLPCKSAFI